MLGSLLDRCSLTPWTVLDDPHNNAIVILLRQLLDKLVARSDHRRYQTRTATSSMLPLTSINIAGGKITIKMGTTYVCSSSLHDIELAAREVVFESS